MEMFYEHRKVHTPDFGNEEDAVKALHEAIPNAEITSIRRVAQSGMNPVFYFDLLVRIEPQSTRPASKAAKEVNDDD